MLEIELLKEKGLKVTPQRIAIVELLQKYGHLSISNIYELIKEKFPSVSLATIYKNLNAMLENDFVKEVKILGQDSKFELNKSSHAHLICKKCQMIKDIDIDQNILKEQISNQDFEIDESSIIFYGICNKCKKS